MAWGRVAGLLAVTAGSAAASRAARAVRARRAEVAAVRPELRTRRVLPPLSVTNRSVLRFMRSRPTQTYPLPADVRTRVLESDLTGSVLYERHDRTRPSPAVLWIHGGGTIMGSPAMSEPWCAAVADDLDALVLSSRYRLAPEHPFPAGFDDCFAALEWLHANAADLGVDPTRIAVGGDSAGGGLAASVAQRAHDTGVPVAFQCLVYPMVDDRTVLHREQGGRGAFVWRPASNRFAWESYLGHEVREHEDRPYAAAARRSDLTGLPPAWIGVGDLDLFYGEDIDYAHRLRASDVPCDLHIEPGMYHGADLYMATTDPMRAFRARAMTALRTALTGAKTS
ncbi:alpha/beta hydrolase [Actinokineospora bangkokensis]|uniref:Alpha/beta hydrolase fold-3 domain-containing protein n=1 Tax=Actinokineospora bangkokensis TaxID=1193682 RepID=A0A1Q9LLB5_9PSEU|nr:alpha/beta hydrolase [Actinokineospora bangkokensis]OLR92827.1 hypothetical protein BJP25_19565 [Actinokineospora bangkokensis]